MAQFVDAASDWRTLLAALAVFGFLPGVFLRMIVLVYPKDHPRRRELVAELYVVPRLERPFWVVQQLEVSLFEGLPARLSAVAARFGSAESPTRRAEGLIAFALVMVLSSGLAGLLTTQMPTGLRVLVVWMSLVALLLLIYTMARRARSTRGEHGES
ncbi:MAG: hypothetical protein S0880_13180 [Actinomycetota bacterium]|nr:hypothetical protein [Actinomycetota bacterium]